MKRRKQPQPVQRMPSLTITLPLDDEQAKAIVVAADRFGVEPWEMAVHILETCR